MGMATARPARTPATRSLITGRAASTLAGRRAADRPPKRSSGSSHGGSRSWAYPANRGQVRARELNRASVHRCGAVRLWSESSVHSTSWWLVTIVFVRPGSGESAGLSSRRAIAQLAEHRSPKPKVVGSSPSCPAAHIWNARGKVNVADKDEVEPTEESSAPEPSSPDDRADAPQDPESEGSASRSATSPRPRSRVTSHRRPKPSWPRTTSRRPDGIDPDGDRAGRHRPDDAEFDEIVRNSGVDGHRSRRRAATTTARSSSRLASERRPRARQSGSAVRPGPRRAPRPASATSRRSASGRRRPSSSASRWASCARSSTRPVSN